MVVRLGTAWEEQAQLPAWRKISITDGETYIDASQ